MSRARDFSAIEENFIGIGRRCKDVKLLVNIMALSMTPRDLHCPLVLSDMTSNSHL